MREYLTLHRSVFPSYLTIESGRMPDIQLNWRRITHTMSLLHILYCIYIYVLKLHTLPLCSRFGIIPGVLLERQWQTFVSVKWLQDNIYM